MHLSRPQYLLSIPLPLISGQISSGLLFKSTANSHSRMVQDISINSVQTQGAQRTYHNVNLIGPQPLRAAADLTAIPAVLLLHRPGNLRTQAATELLLNEKKKNCFFTTFKAMIYLIKQSKTITAHCQITYFNNNISPSSFFFFVTPTLTQKPLCFTCQTGNNCLWSPDLTVPQRKSFLFSSSSTTS